MSSFIPLAIRLAAPPPSQQQEQQQQQQQQQQQEQQQQQNQQELPQPHPHPHPQQQQQQQLPQEFPPSQQQSRASVGAYGSQSDVAVLSPIEFNEETPTPPPAPHLVTGIQATRPQDAFSNVAQWVEATSGAQPKENHQFWLSDPKIVESLFTIHRSAKHLLDFTSSLLGSTDASLGQRPIPLMSNGDVHFMTQLSVDISRSAAGISAVRHHGARAAARKRKTRPEASHRDEDRDDHHGHAHAHGRDRDRDRERDYHGGSSKRVHHSSSAAPRPAAAASSSRAAAAAAAASAAPRAGGWGNAEPVCWKCGRTDTPEWRKGPDGGVLCNVCGLLYAKQKRKMKSSSHSHGGARTNPSS